ncbi:MAG: restriction endonuclease [Chrysiogenetes bacterium]|nr:restriction endonuclease [Chrysiogenetes bacterium]
MAIPDFQTLMLPVLKIGNSGEIQAKQATELLSDEFGLTDEERTQLLPSGTTTTIHNRVAWAVSHMVQAKLLKRPQRGYFTTTDRGKAVLQSPPDRITIKYLEQFPEYVEFRKKKKVTEKVEADGADEDSSTTPEERIDTAYSEINAALKDELLSKVMEASPVFFEKLIVKLLVGMGYGGASDEAGKHVGKSGDGGIDGVINEDKLGLDVIYLQAKRYAPENTVGRPEIQKFAGTLIGMSANKGVFVTTSSFSAQAHEYTKTVPQRIILIDGEKLTSLMLEHNVGARVHRSIDLKNIDEDFFLD